MIFGVCRVIGHSMYPLFNPDDKILVSFLPYVFKKPSIGDVVVFKKDNKSIIKRIKKQDKGKFLVAGDNLGDSKDFGWIERKDIVGKFIFKL